MKITIIRAVQKRREQKKKSKTIEFCINIASLFSLPEVTYLLDEIERNEYNFYFHTII